jgi:hypothetical protein
MFLFLRLSTVKIFPKEAKQTPEKESNFGWYFRLPNAFQGKFKTPLGVKDCYKASRTFSKYH